VRWVAETGSTNQDLMAAAAAGAPDRTVLAAGHQTAGRGRLDRRWEAPPDANLLVSLLFRRLPRHAHELTQRVSLAAALAAERVAGVRARLKWPNDLEVDGRKLAGVLAQRGGAGAGPSAAGSEFLVVGLGLNVGWAPEGAARLGDHLDPLEVLRVLLAELDGLPDDVGPQYRARLGTLGQQVRVLLPDGGELEGRALDVEADGRLVVLDACGITHRIGAGDVVHLRPA
jgi:BirA family biotin operon repressor/biotin-[acetyl-CoA-carboxylase] ligase